MFFLSQEKKQKAKERKKIKTKKKKCVHTHTNIEFILCCLPQTVADIPTDTPLEKTDGHQQVSIVNCFLVRGGTWSPCWDFVSLNCVGLVCAVGQVVSGSCYFCGIIHHLWLSQSFHRLFCVDAESWRQGEIKTPHLGLSVPKSPALCTLSGNSASR